MTVPVVSLWVRAVAVGLVTAFLVFYLLRVLRMLWVSRHIPGPRAWLLVGTVPEMLRMQRDLIGGMGEMIAKYGRTWKLWLGDNMVVVMSDPEELHVFFNNPSLQDKPFLIYEGFRTLIGGEGLLSMAGGDLHRLFRRALVPSFSVDTLRSLVPIFDEQSRRICKRFMLMANTGEVFNAVPLMEDVTVNSVITAVAGDFPELGVERELLGRVLESGDHLVIWLALRPWFHVPFIRRLFCSRNKELEHTSHCMKDYSKKAFDRRFEDLRGRREGTLKAENMNGTSLAEVLVRGRYLDSIQDEDVKMSLMHISVAGVATSTDLLVTSVMTLALYPEVQEQILKEVLTVLGPDESLPVTHAHLARLQYLDRVVREVMRLFPPVHAVGRSAQDDVKLPSGKVIPKGAIVVTSFWHNHRDERWFSEPEKFDPDRHLPENCANRHVYAYTPFSAGSRNCIGLRLGMLFVKTALSSIVRRFHVLPAPGGPKSLKDFKFSAGVSLHPVGGARIRMEPRATPAA